ncbi:MAG: TolC family protein [Verrucomicrobiota bacterium]
MKQTIQSGGGRDRAGFHRFTAVVALLSAMLLSACETLEPGEDPTPSLRRSTGSMDVPVWAKGRISPEWWSVFDDASLHRDVEVALENSPDLAAIAAKRKAAAAQTRAAQVAAWPKLNLGWGWRAGRAREVDFGPYDLAPWKAGAQFSWELDAFGKLKSARLASESREEALHWDLSAARLLLTAEVVRSRFRLNRVSEELALMQKILSADQKIIGIYRSHLKAGIISESELQGHLARNEEVKRGVMELERLRQLVVIELEALRGKKFSSAEGYGTGALAEAPTIPAKDICELMDSHPLVLASESRVRAAYRVSESARLDLLPSIQLNASMMGASPNFLLDPFRVWERSIGPSIDIPVFDPGRRAKWQGQKAEVEAASAEYRGVLVDIIKDVEAAYLNFGSHYQQNQSLKRQVAHIQKVQGYAISKRKAGLVSDIEVMESEKGTLAAQRAEQVMRYQILSDYVDLIVALGGGE